MYAVPIIRTYSRKLLAGVHLKGHIKKSRFLLNSEYFGTPLTNFNNSEAIWEIVWYLDQVMVDRFVYQVQFCERYLAGSSFINFLPRCAFANTPKFRQVLRKGIIVSEKWIDNCHNTKSKVDWRPFRVGRAPSPPNVSKIDEDEDEQSDSGSEYVD